MTTFISYFATINAITWLLIAIFMIFCCIVYRKAIVYYLQQLILIFSDSPSLFSQKRFQTNIAFYAGVGIICCYVWTHRNTLDNWGMLIDAGVLIGIAGYTVNIIQKEKLNPPNQDNK